MSFPDVPGILVAYLSAELTGTHVGTRVPIERPDEFIVVRRVGGTPLYPVRDQARVDVWAWALTDPEAMDLAIACRTAIWEMSGNVFSGVTVYRVGEFMAPQQMDDPETGIPRVWATYELDLRADSVIQPNLGV